METLLEITNVTKRYGAVVACDDVSLVVPRGEIRGLLGQNGAGKSTLMKIVAGITNRERGAVKVAETDLPSGDPYAARAAGVGMVHQHFSLVEPLLVWENVALGDIGHFDEATEARCVRELGERYGLEVDPYARVDDLAPGERQRVEIIKCLRNEPSLVILDEPTSVLTQTESKRLFEVLSRLVRDESRAIVLISHRLEEVLEVTDRITVLRDGAVVANLETSEADVNLLASEMLGRDVSLTREGAAVGMVSAEKGVFDTAAAPAEPRTPVTTDRELLRVDGAVVVARDGHRLLDGLSLRLARGEILGIAGVEGNGQNTLGDVLSGLVTLDEGRVTVDGQPMRAGHGRDPSLIGVVPADRHSTGCVLQLSIAENLVLDHPQEVERHRGILSKRLLRARAERLVTEFGITTPSINLPVGALSGGNQQRVILARELSRTPKLLVVSQPTQGLDVGAMEDIWARLRAAARAGAGVLLISTDLDEIMAIADRVAVIYRGRVIGEMARSAVDLERLGRLMGGAAA